MNFLSHYYFTQKEFSPYYTVGTVLPDLLRNYGGNWRITPLDSPHLYAHSQPLQDLLAGWELHLKIDRIFHNSLAFQQECASLKKHLTPVFTRLPIRPFFLAHIGYEILLDSLLLKEGKVSAKHFYTQLTACKKDTLSEFLSLSGLSVKDIQDFHAFYLHFIESGYLTSYSQVKSIVYALDRIGRRVWHTPFNKTELAAAAVAFHAYQSELSSHYFEVFQYIQTEVK